VDWTLTGVVIYERRHCTPPFTIGQEKYSNQRVIIMGEAAMLSAQVINGLSQLKFGMNRPGTDNRQLALNIMHWLSRLLK